MRRLLADLFYWSLILYLFLFLLENIFSGIVSELISLSYLLIPIVFFGVASSIWPSPVDIQPTTFKTSDFYLAIVLSIVGGGLIYYKLTLDIPLRLVVSSLSAGLILLMSVLVVVPKDYKFPKPKLKYLWLFVLLLPLGIFFKPAPTVAPVVRTSPSLYQIVLVNQTNNQQLSNSYKKLIQNNGYKNVTLDATTSFPATTSSATVMYDPTDSLAGQEIAQIVGQSYKDIQTSPLIKFPAKTIVVIIK